MRHFLAWMAFIGLVTMTGCSKDAADKPKTAQAAGVVMKGGKPLAKVQVAFIPSNGPMAMGTTDEQGHFTLMTSTPGDGALIGEHKVSLGIVTESPVSNSPEEIAAAAKVVSPVPARYGNPDTSGITATVPPEGKKDFKFEITD